MPLAFWTFFTMPSGSCIWPMKAFTLALPCRKKIIYGIIDPRRNREAKRSDAACTRGETRKGMAGYKLSQKKIKVRTAMRREAVVAHVPEVKISE